MHVLRHFKAVPSQLHHKVNKTCLRIATSPLPAEDKTDIGASTQRTQYIRIRAGWGVWLNKISPRPTHSEMSNTINDLAITMVLDYPNILVYNDQMPSNKHGMYSPLPHYYARIIEV